MKTPLEEKSILTFHNIVVVARAVAVAVIVVVVVVVAGTVVTVVVTVVIVDVVVILLYRIRENGFVLSGPLLLDSSWFVGRQLMCLTSLLLALWLLLASSIKSYMPASNQPP